MCAAPTKKRTLAASTLVDADSVASPLPEASRARPPPADIWSLPSELVHYVFDQRLQSGRDALKAFAPTCKAFADFMREIKFARCTRLRIRLSCFYSVSTQKTVAALRGFSSAMWPHIYPTVKHVVLVNADQKRRCLAFYPTAAVRWTALGAFVDETLPTLFPSLRVLELWMGVCSPCHAPPIRIPSHLLAICLFSGSEKTDKQCVSVRDGGALKADSANIVRILRNNTQLRELILTDYAVYGILVHRDVKLRVERFEVYLNTANLSKLGQILDAVRPVHMVLNLFSCKFVEQFIHETRTRPAYAHDTIRHALDAITGDPEQSMRSLVISSLYERDIQYTLDLCATAAARGVLCVTEQTSGPVSFVPPIGVPGAVEVYHVFSVKVETVVAMDARLQSSSASAV